MENSLIEGIKGVISNVLCCFPAYPERITYIDPITCNSLCLEEMRKIVSKVKCPGLIRFPEEKKAVKSVLVSLEEELKKEKQKKQAEEKLQKYIQKNGLCSICKTSYVDCERMQSNFRCYPKGSSCKGNLVIKCPKFTK